MLGYLSGAAAPRMPTNLLPAPAPVPARYLPEEVWTRIRSYMFHDLRTGLHTRDVAFNRVVAEIPRITPGYDYIVWQRFRGNSPSFLFAHFTRKLFGFCVEVRV